MTPPVPPPQQILTVTLVCSARPRASVQNARSKGRHWWGREVHHIKNKQQADRGQARTLCGLDCTGYLTIGEAAAADALSDSNLCRRCHHQTTEGSAR